MAHDLPRDSQTIFVSRCFDHRTRLPEEVNEDVSPRQEAEFGVSGGVRAYRSELLEPSQNELS